MRGPHPPQRERLSSSRVTGSLGAPTRMLAHAGGSLAGKLSAEDSSTSANKRASLSGVREVFVELGDRCLSVRRPRHLVLLFALTLHTPREMKTFTVGYFVGDLARPVDPDFAFAFAGAADWNSAPA